VDKCKPLLRGAVRTAEQDAAGEVMRIKREGAAATAAAVAGAYTCPLSSST